MLFKKLWNWIDEYFSENENKQIKEQKKIIDDLSSEIKDLKEQVNKLVAINKKLSENNKQLINENSELKQQLQNNNQKIVYYDLICKVVEDDVLKQVIEMSNQK